MGGPWRVLAPGGWSRACPGCCDPSVKGAVSVLTCSLFSGVNPELELLGQSDPGLPEPAPGQLPTCCTASPTSSLDSLVPFPSSLLPLVHVAWFLNKELSV